MYDFKKSMEVYEIKGLLKAIERIASEARFQLAKDNLNKLVVGTSYLKEIIEHIETKVDECEKQTLEDENF